MAIKYLSSIDLRTNELQYAVIQPLTTAPTGLTAALGQVYFNTADDKLKIYTSAGWATVGGVNSVTSGNANTITIGGTAGDPTVSANTAAVSNGSLNLVTGDAVYDFVTGLGYVESVSSGNSTFISTAITGTSVDPIVTASLSATGTPDNTKYLRGDNTWSAISGIYSFNVSDGTNSSQVLNAETVTFSGTSNEIEVGQASRTVTIGLPSDVTITNSLTVSGTAQSSFGGQVTIPTTPVANTDAASKAYVDASTAGALVFQGGYNASTNTPNLDSPPTGTIKKGFMWTVTVDGVFFTEQVRVGDSLIAKIDTPTTLADWTTVQSNIDLATLTTVGLGNVNAGTGIDVSYSNGTATVSTTATAYATTITVTGTVTHNLGTKDVIVQLYDTVTFDTVYADVSRATTNTVTVTFASAPTNPIRVLVQK